MSTLTRSLPSPSRLARACLVAIYTAIALLGSAGLHAIAPRCSHSACHADQQPRQTHRGCSHHHHHHHPSTSSDDAPEPQSPPGHCPEGCLICEFAATPVVNVAVIDPPPPLDAVDEFALPPAPHAASPAAGPFWSRGPPARG